MSNKKTERIDIEIISGKKIIFFVYGNIASGKSSFCSAINAYLPKFKHICLDDIRVENLEQNYSLSSYEREIMSINQCKKQVLNADLVIFESTGNSNLFSELKMLTRSFFDCYFIFIDCPDYECSKRFERRKQSGYFSVKPPFGKTKSISEYCRINQAQYRGMEYNLRLDSYSNSLIDIVNIFKNNFNIIDNE